MVRALYLGMLNLMGVTKGKGLKIDSNLGGKPLTS